MRLSEIERIKHILDSLLDELGALPAVPSSSRISRRQL